MDFFDLKKKILLSQGENEERYIKIFEGINKNIEKLKKIDTSQVKPANFPYQLLRTALRSDNNPKTMNLDIFKKNIYVNKINKDGYVVVKWSKDEKY